MMALIEIFFSPGKVFEQVREKSMFLPAFFGVVLASLASAVIVINLIGLETITRKQIESNPRAVEQLGPEGVEKRVQAANTPAIKALSYAIPVIGSTVVLLAAAGLFLGLLSIFGAKVNYLQVLGATAYAWFPFSVLLGVMSCVIILLAPDRAELDLRNLTATNPGAFMSRETTGKALYSFATSMDVIVLAQIAFISYGLSKVSGLSFGKCVMVVGGLWLIYVLGKTGIAAM
jgi:hypothetical protein